MIFLLTGSPHSSPCWPERAPFSWRSPSSLARTLSLLRVRYKWRARHSLRQTPCSNQRGGPGLRSGPSSWSPWMRSCSSAHREGDTRRSRPAKPLVGRGSNRVRGISVGNAALPASASQTVTVETPGVQSATAAGVTSRRPRLRSPQPWPLPRREDAPTADRRTPGGGKGRVGPRVPWAVSAPGTPACGFSFCPEGGRAPSGDGGSYCEAGARRAPPASSPDRECPLLDLLSDAGELLTPPFVGLLLRRSHILSLPTP
jgi:hypothetical protein